MCIGRDSSSERLWYCPAFQDARLYFKWRKPLRGWISSSEENERAARKLVDFHFRFPSCIGCKRFFFVCVKWRWRGQWFSKLCSRRRNRRAQLPRDEDREFLQSPKDLVGPHVQPSYSFFSSNHIFSRYYTVNPFLWLVRRAVSYGPSSWKRRNVLCSWHTPSPTYICFASKEGMSTI